MSMETTIVIVTYNSARTISKCLSAARQMVPGRNVVVVDNASLDSTVEDVRREHGVSLVVSDRNLGFAKAANMGAEQADTPYILFLNPDAFCDASSFERVIQAVAELPRCGVAGVALVDPLNAPQPSARRFPTPFRLFLTRTGLAEGRSRGVPNESVPGFVEPTVCDWVPGCFLLTRLDLFSALGGFDERFFLYYEEVDYCMRAKQAGWQTVWVPFMTVVHVGGESARSLGKVTSAGRQLLSHQMLSEFLYFGKHDGRQGMIKHLVWFALALAGSGTAGRLRLKAGTLASGIRMHDLIAAYRRAARLAF